VLDSARCPRRGRDRDYADRSHQRGGLDVHLPIVIKRADDPIKNAEAGKLTPETKRDHGDAVRKARTAVAFAEEAIILQSP
jgi:hypothetical protein